MSKQKHTAATVFCRLIVLLTFIMYSGLLATQWTMSGCHWPLQLRI